MSFNCDKCGACCRHIRDAVESVGNPPKDHPLHFPHSWNQEGECKLLEDNKCKDYENRPLICRVEEAYKFFNMSKEDYYKLNKESCVRMRDLKKD